MAKRTFCLILLLSHVLSALAGAGVCMAMKAVGLFATGPSPFVPTQHYRELSQETLALLIRWEENSVQSRLNSLACVSAVRAGKTLLEGTVAHAAVNQKGDGTTSIFAIAIEGRQRRNALIVAFQDDKGRLVLVTHRLPPNYPPSCLSGTLTPWCRVERKSLSELAVQGSDGIWHVDSAKVEKAAGCIPIPDGEIAVGFQYPDGTYTNFILLDRLSPQEEIPPEDWIEFEGVWVPVYKPSNTATRPKEE